MVCGCNLKMETATRSYGRLPDGRQVSVISLTNAGGLKATLTDYGATLISMEVPDREGKTADITLGYDTLEGWLSNTSYFGATVGRYANRIAQGRFTLDGEAHTLAANNGANHLHGGITGFDKKLWSMKEVCRKGAVGVKFTYTSPDGEEGFPGNLETTVTYWLTRDNELHVEFEASTDKATLVNLAHHSYWNLTGDPNRSINDHRLMLAADFFLPVDEGLIPVGELRSVEGTPFDFTRPTVIGARLNEADQQLQYGRGYDHCWVLRKGQGLQLAATLHDPGSGRTMDILTDQPGIQFYGGNFLDGTITGKNGIRYQHRTGLCLETELFPDSPNHTEFPSAVLRPGQTYQHTMVHRFYVAP
jgi:aldose 1-epimerase